MIRDATDPRLFGCGGDHCVLAEDVFALFLDCIRELYEDSYLTRRGELRPRKTRAGNLTHNDRNVLWGQVRACERLFPPLRDLHVSLNDIGEEAERDAWEWMQARHALGEALAA